MAFHNGRTSNNDWLEDKLVNKMIIVITIMILWWIVGGFDWVIDTYLNMNISFNKDDLYLQQIIDLKSELENKSVIISEAVEVMQKFENQMEIYKDAINRLIAVIKQKDDLVDLYLHILKENNINIDDLYKK